MNKFTVFNTFSYPVLLKFCQRRCHILKHRMWHWLDLLLELEITFIRITDQYAKLLIAGIEWNSWYCMMENLYVLCSCVTTKRSGQECSAHPNGPFCYNCKQLLIFSVCQCWFNFAVINQRQRSRTEAALMLVSQSWPLCLWARLGRRNAWIAIASRVQHREALSSVVANRFVALFDYTFLSCQ